MKITNNAPLTVAFAAVAAAVLLLNSTIFPGLTAGLFTVGPMGSFSFGDPLDYVRLVSHGIGHADLGHLVGNFSLILLVGPFLEHRFGWKNLLTMMLITLFITGVLNVLFFSNGLLGASGIVFMFILLGSFTGAKKGEIPITFILVALLYLVGEILSLFGPQDGISQVAHILGGLAGSVFGFLSLNNTASTATE